jgi:hypothetical protein
LDVADDAATTRLAHHPRRLVDQHHDQPVAPRPGLADVEAGAASDVDDAVAVAQLDVTEDPLGEEDAGPLVCLRDCFAAQQQRTGRSE